MEIDGKIKIIGEKHTVEYDTADQLGAGTLFLGVSAVANGVPIYVDHVEEVIEMLKRGKEAIDALEPNR